MKHSIEQLQDHFRRLYSIIGFISRTAGGCGGQRQGCDGPNPFYGQSGDLSVILGEYYGMPAGVTTPLGWLQIDRPCIVDESWRPKVEEALGLVPVYGEWKEWGGEREFRAIYNDGPMGGEQGPGWALARDTDGNPLPKTTTSIKGWFMSPVTEDHYTYEEANAIWGEHIAPIFSRPASVDK